MAGAALLLARLADLAGALVAAAMLGAGFGVYRRVDAALITQVLPTAEDRAKDLGIINIANSAPQVLGPALAAPIVVAPGRIPGAVRGDGGRDAAGQRVRAEDPLSAIGT